MSDQYSQSSLWMKRLLFVAGMLVLIIGLPLFIAPTMTEVLFSWTVNPPITAACLGSAYLAAFVLEASSSTERYWSNARIAVPAVLLFTVMTLIATLLHLGKFHFGSDFHFITQLITFVWLIVYASVPVIMLLIWIAQTRHRGRETKREFPLPLWSKLVLVIQALTMLSIGCALFLFPEATKDSIWPWALSILTARAIGAWLLGIGLLAAHILIENDYRRVRNALLALMVGSTLELVSLWRLADDEGPSGEVINWGGTGIWIYIAFLLSIIVIGIHGWLTLRRRFIFL
jgi:hypothetical protein